MRPVPRSGNLVIFTCRLFWNMGASTSWNSQGLTVLYLDCFTFDPQFSVTEKVMKTLINDTWPPLLDLKPGAPEQKTGSPTIRQRLFDGGIVFLRNFCKQTTRCHIHEDTTWSTEIKLEQYWVILPRASIKINGDQDLFLWEAWGSPCRDYKEYCLLGLDTV